MGWAGKQCRRMRRGSSPCSADVCKAARAPRAAGARGHESAATRAPSLRLPARIPFWTGSPGPATCPLHGGMGQGAGVFPQDSKLPTPGGFCGAAIARAGWRRPRQQAAACVPTKCCTWVAHSCPPLQGTCLAGSRRRGGATARGGRLAPLASGACAAGGDQGDPCGAGGAGPLAKAAVGGSTGRAPTSAGATREARGLQSLRCSGSWHGPQAAGAPRRQRAQRLRNTGVSAPPRA